LIFRKAQSNEFRFLTVATCRRTPGASRPLPLRTGFSGRSTVSTLRPPLGRWAAPHARRRTAMRW